MKIAKLKIKNFQQGFTLIEAVVATAVFAFVVSSILGIYITVIRLDSRTRADRAVGENARYITEYLAKLLRNGTINYASYPGGNTSGTTTSLWVLNQADELERIYLNGNDLMLEKTAATTLNSSGVKVTRLQFLVSPSVNPLTPAKLSSQQPSLTVILELTSNYGDKLGNIAQTNIQTTFTSRDYPSREP